MAIVSSFEDTAHMWREPRKFPMTHFICLFPSSLNRLGKRGTIANGAVYLGTFRPTVIGVLVGPVSGAVTLTPAVAALAAFVLTATAAVWVAAAAGMRG